MDTAAEPNLPPFSLEDVLLRFATYDDVPGIKVVANSHEHTKHFSHPAYCNRPKFEAGEVVVAEWQNRVVGFAVLRIKRSTEDTEIDIIAVGEEYRSKGIGRSLLDYISTAQPNAVLWLNVHKSSEPAIKFYQRYGFKIRTDEHPIYYRMRYVCKRGVLY